MTGFAIGQHSAWRRNLRAESAQSYWLQRAEWESRGGPIMASWSTIACRVLAAAPIAGVAVWGVIELVSILKGLLT